jgi:hypothetical protein
MAYHLHHRTTFNSTLNERLYIELYKKDVEPDEVTDLLAMGFRCSYLKGEGNKFDSILSVEALLTLWLQHTDDVEFDDFIVTYPDEWKMVAFNDDHTVFVGFLTPGEGRSDFQDKPYEITLSATDDLGLLKGITLTDNEGEKFVGVNLLITYVLAILNKTGHGLGLRVYSNITEESMETRIENEQADTFNQTGLHARTFLKSSIEFCDCYKALEIILGEYFTLYQWSGRWVILRVGEMQDSVGAKIWWTEYDSAGTVTGSGQSLENPCAVGRDRIIHPVNVNQTIGSEFAVKSAQYTYNYTPWPELPTNNRFEFGELRSETVNEDGTITKIFEIDGWTFGQWLGQPTQINNLPFLTTPSGGTADAYRKSTYNIYGVETEREIYVGGENAGSNQHKVLQCDTIPVKAGDRVEVSFDFKKTFNSDGTFQFAAVYIKPSEGTWPANRYTLENNNSSLPDGGPLFWQPATGGFNILSRFYDSSFGEDVGNWLSINMDIPEIPVDGDLYIWFYAENPGASNFSVYRNFKFTYRPFIAGGYLQVKGDYARTQQDASLYDKVEEEVFISDSLKKVLKGTLYRADLETLTTPTWHRFNVLEERHFKELGELARYNNVYRRMWNIEGTFDGLKYKPDDNPLVIEPLSFHRHFTFPDSAKLSGRYFMLVPPLILDYATGSGEMNFVEVLQADSTDGNSLGDSHIPLNYIFE